MRGGVIRGPWRGDFIADPASGVVRLDGRELGTHVDSGKEFERRIRDCV